MYNIITHIYIYPPLQTLVVSPYLVQPTRLQIVHHHNHHQPLRMVCDFTSLGSVGLHRVAEIWTIKWYKSQGAGQNYWTQT